MSDEAKCCECGRTVSYETGFTMSGTLAEGSPVHIQCPDCAPHQSNGYTLADLERWKEDIEQSRSDREFDLIERFGADVYFHVKGPTFPPDEQKNG